MDRLITMLYHSTELVVSVVMAPHLLSYLKSSASPGHLTLPPMRPLHAEHHGTTASNDTDSSATLRTGVRGLARAAPLPAEARSTVHAGLSSCLSGNLAE